MKWMCAVYVLLAMHSTLSTARAADWSNTRPDFPLHVADGGTYLEDAAGHPFMVHGDTAWSLIVQLSRDDVNIYLADRRKRGFNALLVNLVEHQFSSKPPANLYGDRPFKGPPFANMDERYFDHAAWVLQRAEEEGFVVFLAPAYAGANGGGQGWYREVVKAGADTLRKYGTFVAKRFRERRNLIWVHGGDFNVPEKALVRAVVSGIERATPNSIHTVHSTRETATAAYWSGDQWLSLDTVYTYGDTRAAVLAQTGPNRTMPVIMIEGLYEGEHGTDEEMIRRQAYGAILSGAAGHFFGNNPIWNFGPGLYASALSWQESLNSRGAECMSYLRSFFEDFPWWLVSPRSLPGIKVDGLGYSASSSDNSFGLVYLVDASSVTLDRLVVGRQHDTRWFDPSSGRWYIPSAGMESDASSEKTLRPPAIVNEAGGRDWLLMLRFRD